MDVIFTILAGLAVWRVVSIVRQIISTRRHLSASELNRYLIGGRNYSQTERDRVSQHLGLCEQCQRLMDDCIHGRAVEDSLIDE